MADLPLRPLKPRLCLAVFQSHFVQKEIGHELSQARIFEFQLSNARESSGFVRPVADDRLLRTRTASARERGNSRSRILRQR